MPDFAYIARDLKGQRVTGTVAAGSEREAVNVISGKSLFPIEVSVDKPKTGIQFGRRVKGQLMASTFGQLASLLRSGVPLLRTISIIRDQTSNSRLKEVLGEVHSQIEEGSTLAEAMARHPRIFSDMSINMVRAGGEGGFLEDALDRVASFTEQQEDLKSRTVGALAYPVILAGVGTTIIIVLLVFFVPKFSGMFDQLRERGELPMMTDLLLGLSEGIWDWWWAIAGVIFLVGFFSWSRLSTEEGKRWRDKIKLKVPVVGGIFQNLAVARFCRVLGTLLHNGVPILRSLDISRSAAGNRVISEAIAEASENISAGEALAEPLAKSGYFPVTVTEMITVAEEAATLDTVLVQISDDLEKRTFRRLDLFVRMLEPFMLLIMAGIVLCVVIALLLPVIKMGSTI
jgi:type II secretory pathway component PulF